MKLKKNSRRKWCLIKYITKKNEKTLTYIVVVNAYAKNPLPTIQYHTVIKHNDKTSRYLKKKTIEKKIF